MNFPMAPAPLAVIEWCDHLLWVVRVNKTDGSYFPLSYGIEKR